jgi:LuxR family maltose regulon positive regulatory protein
MKGYELAQNIASISFNGYSSLLLAETLYRAGEPESALENIEKIDRNLLKNDRQWLTVLAYALKLKLLSRTGQHEKSDYIFNHVIRSGTNHDFEYYIYGIASVHYLISKSRYDEAFPLLEELSAGLRNSEVTGLFVELELMKAKILILQGKETEAGNCILNSLIKTQDEGFIRLYVNEGEDVERIIKEIKRKKSTRSSQLLDAVSNDYLADLIAAFSKENRINRIPEVEVLSSRELSILQLIAENYSNQEIANELYISITTVKTHVRNILLKLGVNNRLEAAAKARERQIL